MMTGPVQPAAGDPPPQPAEAPGPRAINSGTAQTWVDSPPPEDELRATRLAQLEQLRHLQSAFLTSAADPVLVATYAPRFVQYADNIYSASTVRELALTGLQIDQLKSAWEQFRRTLSRRDQARLHAVALLVLVFGFLVGITVFDEHFTLDVTDEVRLLHVPVYVVVWSMIGSICSLLYRFNHSGDAELDDPMRVLLTRPLMGIALGSFSYLVVQLGFLTMSDPGSVPPEVAAAAAQQPPNDRVVHLMIVVAFIVGFSDRLSEQVLKSLVGRFGGDRNGELVSLERLSPGVTPSALTAILGAGGIGSAGNVPASPGSAGNVPASPDSPRVPTATPSSLNGASTPAAADLSGTALPVDVPASDRPDQDTRSRY
jgi:hypothetical protein